MNIGLNKKKVEVEVVERDSVIKGNILFEQPLNEYMRLCLRLESLFQKFDCFFKSGSVFDCQVSIEVLFDILNILDRPDLKNKLGQILNQYIASYTNLEKNPQVDSDKLQDVLFELRQSVDVLQNMQGKIGQNIKDNEFLSAIQQRLAMPAWSCSFNFPAFHTWMHLDALTRQNYLQEWSGFFLPLRKIVNVLLRLMRESTDFDVKTAKAGFYQTAFDPSIAYQIIRIIVPSEQLVYPEISVGRHRLTIHFCVLNTEGKANQLQYDIDFSLACCKLSDKLN